MRHVRLQSVAEFRALPLYRSSHRRCSVKMVFLQISQKFTGKNTCARVSFFNNVPGQACNCIEKETLAQMFSCEFCEISKNNFFTEHLWATVSGCIKINPKVCNFLKEGLHHWCLCLRSFATFITWEWLLIQIITTRKLEPLFYPPFHDILVSLKA